MGRRTSAGEENRGQSPISQSGSGDSGNRALTPIFRQKGFTYLALLMVVAIGGAVLAAVGELASHASQREKEAELLFAGRQFRQAIASYYEHSPGVKRYPQALEDLLEDKRTAAVQRHLRRLYRDPMTGKADWHAVEAPGGGIMGVRSASPAEPIKVGGFSKQDQALEGAARYSDWPFVYTPPAPPASAPAPAPSPTGLPASR